MTSWFSSPTGPAQLSALGVCKAYGTVPVLYPVSFELGAGGALALLGPNGSGKTTLLRLLAGLERPSDGSVSMPSGSRADLVGHDSFLYEDLTGLENLAFALKIAVSPASPFDLGAALEAVGLSKHAGERVRAYSAGMKKRLGLARMLLFQPDILLLDEPHASLDADGQSLVDALIREARDGGRVVVLASHDHDRAAELCDNVLCLDSGRIAFQGPAADFTRTASPLFLVQSDRSAT